jgi:hypothetical protein
LLPPLSIAFVSRRLLALFRCASYERRPVKVDIEIFGLDRPVAEYPVFGADVLPNRVCDALKGRFLALWVISRPKKLTADVDVIGLYSTLPPHSHCILPLAWLRLRASSRDAPEMEPRQGLGRRTGSSPSRAGSGKPPPTGAAPAGGARNPAPGRLRDSARAALGPLCE